MLTYRTSPFHKGKLREISNLKSPFLPLFLRGISPTSLAGSLRGAQPLLGKFYSLSLKGEGWVRVIKNYKTKKTLRP
jgi:hypothetical protein